MARPARTVASRRHQQRRPGDVGQLIAARGVEPVDQHRTVARHDDVAGMQVAVTQPRRRVRRDQLERGDERRIDPRRRSTDLARQPIAQRRQRHGRHEREQVSLQLGQRSGVGRHLLGVLEHVLPHRSAVHSLVDARRPAMDRLDAQESRCRRAGATNRRGIERLEADPCLRRRRRRAPSPRRRAPTRTRTTGCRSPAAPQA